MPKLFNVDIAGELNKAMGPLMLPATLTHFTPGTRTAGSLAAGTNPTSTTHTCRGFTEDYADGRIDGTIVQKGDRIVSIFGASISPVVVPAENDKVTIEGRTYVIVGKIRRDPAGALYQMQAR